MHSATRQNVRAIACDADPEGALQRVNNKRALQADLPFQNVGMGPPVKPIREMHYVDAVSGGVAARQRSAHHLSPYAAVPRGLGTRDRA